MKRASIFMVALLIPATIAVSEDVEAKQEFAVSIGPDAALGLTNILVGAQARFLWKPGFFGLSAGVRAETDVNAFDVYLVPSAGLRLGWLSIEGGAGFKVYDAPAPEGQVEAALSEPSPFIKAGLSIPVGPVSIDAGARLQLTDTYAIMEVDDVGDAIAAPIVVALLAVLGMAKLDLGLNYAYWF